MDFITQVFKRFSVYLRYDGAPHLMVLIPLLDLSNDGFKGQIRYVVDQVTKKYGTKVNVDIYDDLGVLEMVNKSDEINKVSGNRLNKAQYARVTRHNVALYVGQVETEPEPYELSYFPFDMGNVPNAERYRGTEIYEPTLK